MAGAPLKAMLLLCTLLLLIQRVAGECLVVRRDDSSTGCASLGSHSVTVSRSLGSDPPSRFPAC